MTECDKEKANISSWKAM